MIPAYKGKPTKTARFEKETQPYYPTRGHSGRSVAPRLLRALLVGHRRMVDGARPAPHDLLLQSQHLPGARIRDTQGGEQAPRRDAGPTLDRRRLRPRQLAGCHERAGARARARTTLRGVLRLPHAGHGPHGAADRNRLLCHDARLLAMEGPGAGERGRSGSSRGRPWHRPFGLKTGARTDCRNGAINCSRSISSTTSSTAAASLVSPPPRPWSGRRRRRRRKKGRKNKRKNKSFIRYLEQQEALCISNTAS